MGHFLRLRIGGILCEEFSDILRLHLCSIRSSRGKAGNDGFGKCGQVCVLNALNFTVRSTFYLCVKAEIDYVGKAKTVLQDFGIGIRSL